MTETVGQIQMTSLGEEIEALFSPESPFVDPDPDWAWLRYRKRILAGETTGDLVCDFVIQFPFGVDDLRKSVRWIHRLQEQIRGHVGEQILFYTTYSIPSGCLDRGPVAQEPVEYTVLGQIREPEIILDLGGGEELLNRPELQIVTFGHARNVNFFFNPQHSGARFNYTNLLVPSFKPSVVCIGAGEIEAWKSENMKNSDVYAKISGLLEMADKNRVALAD